MGKLNINNGGVDTNKKMANIDERFGPYTSIEAANAALGGQGRNTITAGLTVGILTANAGVKEYWYQPNEKTGQLELIPKGGNAADNPTEGNFASFDANGNVVDSGNKATDFAPADQAVPMGDTEDVGKVLEKQASGFGWVPKPVDGDTPQIDLATKLWSIGGELTDVYAEGKSALQIYNDLHSEDTPLTEAEFIDMLKATYPMKYVGYDSNADSANVGAELNTLDSKAAASTYEHGLYLMPNADPNVDTPTGSVLFICVNVSADTYKWVKMGDFNIPNNIVTNDRIDDTNLENPAANSLAKASDVAPLKRKLKDVDYEEREYTVDNGGIVINSKSFVSGYDGEYHNNSTSVRKTAEIYVEGFEKVEFLGALLKSVSANWGYAFYDDEEDTLPIAGSYGGFDVDSSIETIGTKIYNLNIPNNAKVLRYTISNSENTHLNESDLWVKLKKGASITDMINQSVEEIAEDVDAINESLQKIEYTVDDDFTIQMDAENEDEEYKGFIRNNGGLKDSEKFRIRIYEGIDSSNVYTISTNYASAGLTGFNLVHYYHDDTHLGYELNWDDSNHLTHAALTLPEGTNIIKINTRLGSTSEYSLELSEETGYYDVKEINDSVEKLKGASRKSLTVEILSEDNIRIRCRYDDDNDIVMSIGYNNNYKKFRNFLRPRNVYIGNKDYTTQKLMTNAIISHGISDTIGPITMDWCGPIYANHGYSTPSLSFVDLVDTSEGIDNPFINPQDEIGSIWEDDIDALEGSSYSKRRYKIANITDTKVYLLPVIYLDNDNYPHRDFVYYNSPKDQITIYDLDENGDRQSDGEGGYKTKTTTGLNLTKVADATGKTGLPIGTPFVGKYSRFDYQVCECKNFMLSIDGLDIQINKVGTYQCNEFMLCYQQICYDASLMQDKFINGWNGTSFTNDFNDVPIQVIFDRQFVFSGSLGFLSYANTHKMNVLRPFKMGGDFDGNPNGRYLGCAPTAFLKHDEDSELNSVTYIPKLKKVWTSQNHNDIDFSKEFNSNTMSTAPQITLHRSTTDLDNVDNMSERIYSYIKDGNDVPVFGVGGGHSLVRGVSVNSIKNTMVPLNGVFGWWNPPISNKFYAAIMRHGNDVSDNMIVNTDYIGVNEGYFCWYKPQLTDSLTGATIHCFYYKSGNVYIVYIHTKGSHSKYESVILPTLMDGMTVVEVIEQKNNNIQVLDDIVVANRLHIACNASDYDECNWIVLKIK